MTNSVPIPTARELMTKSPVTLRPDQSLADAMVVLREHKISGAPVVNEDGDLVGMLSEFDCLKVLASGEFFEEEVPEAHRIETRMSTEVLFINPDLDLYGIAHMFLSRRIRRLPVVEDGRVIGVVSRRDILRGVESVWKARGRLRNGARPKGLFLSATDANPQSIDARN